jgi:hypothetical protein
MNKCLQQQAIQRRHDQDTEQTDTWLKSQGWSPDTFVDTDFMLLQAQHIAQQCLKQYGQLLAQNEAQVLNHFLQSMQKKVKRQRLGSAEAFKVMNIARVLNRRVFKQRKQQLRHI